MDSKNKSKLNPSLILLFYGILVSIITYIGAYEKDVWLFEVIIGWILIAILFLIYKKFRFSNFVYILVGIHFTVLAIGAHYSYAKMPLFDYIKDIFHLSRNYYDRVGHFFQGFVPAIIVREILLRKTRIERGWLMNLLISFFILGTAAFYEFIEWWTVILFYPTQGVLWLGMQGDVWDAHQDMLIAFIGSILALLLLAKLHDNSMKKCKLQS